MSPLRRVQLRQPFHRQRVERRDGIALAARLNCADRVICDAHAVRKIGLHERHGFAQRAEFTGGHGLNLLSSARPACQQVTASLIGRHRIQNPRAVHNRVRWTKLIRLDKPNLLPIGWAGIGVNVDPWRGADARNHHPADVAADQRRDDAVFVGQGFAQPWPCLGLVMLQDAHLHPHRKRGLDVGLKVWPRQGNDLGHRGTHINQRSGIPAKADDVVAFDNRIIATNTGKKSLREVRVAQELHRRNPYRLEGETANFSFDLQGLDCFLDTIRARAGCGSKCSVALCNGLGKLFIGPAHSATDHVNRNTAALHPVLALDQVCIGDGDGHINLSSMGFTAPMNTDYSEKLGIASGNSEISRKSQSQIVTKGATQ